MYGSDGTTADGGEALREQRTVSLGTPHTLPYSNGIEPLRGDAMRLYRIVVEARDASGGLIATAKAISGFAPGRIVTFDLVLDDACRAVTCADAALTCRAAVCVDAHVNPTSLATYGTDAGVDAGGDAGDPGCGSGHSPTDAGCVDVDECATNNGGCGSPGCFTCQNVIGAAPVCVPLATPPTQITYPMSTYALAGRAPPPALAPIITGTITHCTSMPALPDGLTLDPTTCVINGAPITPQGQAAYAITAGNSCADVITTLQLSISTATVTVVDPTTGKTWTRCPIGQTYDAGTHTCTGTASALAFCSVQTNDCNGGVMTADLGSGFLAGATSAAYDACDQLVLEGNPDFHLPDIPDLRGIRVCSMGATTPGTDDQDACVTGSTVPTIDNRIFPLPSTSINWSRHTSYWSSAWGQFLALETGTTSATGKSFGASVFCVRP